MVVKLMEKSPRQRYQSCNGLILDLEYLFNRALARHSSCSKIEKDILLMAFIAAFHVYRLDTALNNNADMNEVAGFDVQKLFRMDEAIVCRLCSQRSSPILFKPARFDVGFHGTLFWQCEKLYSRDNEVSRLMDIITRTKRPAHVILVSPPSEKDIVFRSSQTIDKGSTDSAVLTGPNTVRWIIVTGASGCGKTKMIRSLRRLLPAPQFLFGKRECL